MTNDIRTRADFERETAGKGKLVLFYSEYCPFCRAFLPAFEEAAAAAPALYAGLRTDLLPELEDEFGVEVVPTVLFFEGGRLVRRLDGRLGRGLSAAELKDFEKECAGGRI